MSNDELTQYFTARGRRERGQQEIIGAEGQAQQPAYPSPTVEGEVDSIVFRTGFGSKDTETERMEYIEEKFGPNTAVKFGPEDYGINLDNVEASIKEDYNLESSGTIRVNEPGFTKYDIPQFIGEYRGPLIATTLAAPFLAPLGFIAGVAATGAVATPIISNQSEFNAWFSSLNSGPAGSRKVINMVMHSAASDHDAVVSRRPDAGAASLPAALARIPPQRNGRANLH